MRKILLTSVGVAALAVGANATDFTLSGTAKIDIDDAGDSSVTVSTAIGVSKTFDNGMALSLSNTIDHTNIAGTSEVTLTSDAISVTFGDIDQNEKNPGLNGNGADADISGDGASNASDNNGAISLGTAIGGVGIGAAMNNAGDTLFGASITTDLGGIAMTVGADMYSDNDTGSDQTAMGVKATLGSLVAVINSVQNDTGTDDTNTYSATYTTGGLVIGMQGSDANTGAVSATYTIVPGMQFELGNEDNGTATVSSAELQMTF
jgi:hypothetical protein